MEILSKAGKKERFLKGFGSGFVTGIFLSLFLLVSAFVIFEVL